MSFFRTVLIRWRLYAVNEPGNRFAIKAPLPRSGRDCGTDMVKVSGVSDATFCHKNRFLAVAKTRDGAWALLKKALNGVYHVTTSRRQSTYQSDRANIFRP